MSIAEERRLTAYHHFVDKRRIKSKHDLNGNRRYTNLSRLTKKSANFDVTVLKGINEKRSDEILNLKKRKNMIL